MIPEDFKSVYKTHCTCKKHTTLTNKRAYLKKIKELGLCFCGLGTRKTRYVEVLICNSSGIRGHMWLHRLRDAFQLLSV